MIYHRYEAPDLKYGVIGALDDVLDLNDDNELDLLFSLTGFMEDHLERPMCPSGKVDGPCWFTPAGHKKFRKMMKRVCEELESRGVRTVHLRSDLSGKTIIYRDKYQVVVKP